MIKPGQYWVLHNALVYTLVKEEEFNWKEYWKALVINSGKIMTVAIFKGIEDHYLAKQETVDQILSFNI